MGEKLTSLLEEPSRLPLLKGQRVDFRLPRTRQQEQALLEGKLSEEEDEARSLVAYVGLDAFSVPMQQSGGGRAEHRMLYVGMIYNPQKTDSFYLVDFDLSRITGRLRQSGVDLGLGQVDQVIAISDAGNGLEHQLKKAFHEDLVCILDWYHVVEYLHEFVRAYWPETVLGEGWLNKHKGILRHRGGEGLHQALEESDLPTDAKNLESWKDLCRYIANHKHRMDYPHYRQQGWDIGSGPVEAGCKRMAERLKGVGMRWGEAGAFKVGSFHACYESGPQVWDALWDVILPTSKAG